MSAELIVNKAIVNQFISEMYESNGENVRELITDDFHVDAWGGDAPPAPGWNEVFRTGSHGNGSV